MKRAKTAALKSKKSAVARRAVDPAKKAAKPVAKKPAELQDYISAVLDSDKAKNIVVLPLKGKTTIADYMLIATGTSSRHVAGMASKLRDKLSTERKIKARIEGADSGDWVIVDAGDVMVHLFREEVREFYDLEKLWGGDFSTVNYTRYQSV
jgi:ribosome-associated protein